MSGCRLNALSRWLEFFANFFFKLFESDSTVSSLLHLLPTFLKTLRLSNSVTHAHTALKQTLFPFLLFPSTLLPLSSLNMQSPTRTTSPIPPAMQHSDSQRYPVTPSQYPESVLQSHDLGSRIAAPSTSKTPRVSPSPPAQSCSQPIEVDSLGTAENPLIPKRRRRTSPTELAILEEEYRLNQKPDQGERAKVAQRLGMTSRAIQVWYQNRR